MTEAYAIIDADNRAINFITWDGVSEFYYGQDVGCQLVSLYGVTGYNFGQIWDGQNFIDPGTPPPPPEVPESISRRQCAKQLFIMGLITGPEAVDMARSGMPPAFVQASFNNLPQNDQYIAEMDFAANTYDRSNPLLNSIMVANGNTQEELDQFFIDAAAL